MKFAFCLFKYFPFGGLQRDLLRIAEECLRRGHTIDVYTMAWQGETLPGITVHTISVTEFSNHGRCWRFAEKLQQQLAKENYDLIVGFNKLPGLDVYFAADPCYVAKAQQQKPYWYTLLPRYRVYAQLERAVFDPRNATEILILVEREQKLFQQFYSTPNERFHYLPPGVAFDRKPSKNTTTIRLALRKELNISEQAHLILMIGSGFKTKGLDRALLAIAALPAELKQKTYLCVIGQDNPQSFIRQAKRLHIEKQIQFLGGRNDVPRFLASADLLIHPAYSENTGLVLLEALVAGLPVLTTDVCGYAEHVINADAGSVLPSPFSQAQFNQELAWMLTAPKRLAWRTNALAYAAQTDLHSFTNQAVDYLENFAQLKAASRSKIVEDVAKKLLFTPEVVEVVEKPKRRKPAKSTKIKLQTGNLAIIEKDVISVVPKQHTKTLPVIEKNIKEYLQINRGFTQNINLPWFTSCLELNDDLKHFWQDADVFTQIFQQEGQLYRQQKQRQTLLFFTPNKSYFLKLHNGVGWSEIFKNIFQGRWPILGAQQEWRALARLSELGIYTANLAGFGNRGSINPAKLQSFVVMEELHNTISLEDFCQQWAKNPPAPRLKWTLIKEVARIARVLHNHHLCHRDFYLCHFLLDITNGIEYLNPNFIRLYLIDLHRVLQREVYLPERWIIKDLAGLYFSSLEIGLTRRDILRFIKYYRQRKLKNIFPVERNFWHKITWRAQKLYGKEKLAILMQPKLNMPLNFVLADGSLLMAEHLLRVVPRKRWVLLAQWPQHQVVAKIFRNWRAAKQELIGYQALTNANITTPRLLRHGWCAGEKLYALLFEYVYPAQNYMDLIMQPAHDNIQHLEALITVLAKLHQAGLQQTDLHFKNFLASNTTTYVLDPGTIKSTTDKRPLRENSRLKNLALLIAQLPAKQDCNIEHFYSFYTRVSATPYTTTGLALLKQWIDFWRNYRLRRYQRKVMRSTTQLICRKNWWSYSVCERAYDSRAMQVLLRNPDAILNSPFTKLLKQGNSCTVGLISVEGKLLVVKRYNIKNFWHGLKRAFTISRAEKSWRGSHLLQLLELNTAKPIAMMEQRCGPLRHKAYFVSEYVEGVKLNEFFNKKFDKEQAEEIANNIKQLLQDLAKGRISHGDLKATNIILVDNQPYLLDLDALRLHRFAWLARRALKRDWQRFLRNWEGREKILELFK